MSAIPVIRSPESWDAWQAAVVRYAHNQRLQRFINVDTKFDQTTDPYYTETEPARPVGEAATMDRLNLWRWDTDRFMNERDKLTNLNAAMIALIQGMIN